MSVISILRLSRLAHFGENATWFSTTANPSCGIGTTVPLKSPLSGYRPIGMSRIIVYGHCPGAGLTPWQAKHWVHVGYGLEALPLSLPEAVSEIILHYRDTAEPTLPMDIVYVSHLYARIDGWLHQCPANMQAKRYDARLDQWLMHRILGLPLFLLLMYSVFFITIGLGNIVGDALTQSLTLLTSAWHFSQGWAQAIFIEGALQGIMTTLALVPSIGLLFFFLHGLEECGYMARAAFVMDRIMQALGLPGRAFIALMVGFGCNVPAVMATRMLSTWRERVLTALMVPFMSCSARLAIYTVFAQICFPKGAHWVVFLLYLLGMLAAVLTGWLAKFLTVPEKMAALIMELPRYQTISAHALLKRAWQSAVQFMRRAVRIILPVAMLLGAISHLSTEGRYVSDMELSWLALNAKAWVHALLNDSRIIGQRWWRSF